VGRKRLKEQREAILRQMVEGMPPAAEEEPKVEEISFDLSPAIEQAPALATVPAGAQGMETPGIEQQTEQGREEERTPPTWRQMHLGTSPRTEALLFQRYREALAWKKLRQMQRLHNAARRLALVGLRARHPEASEEELMQRLANLIYREERARRGRP